MPLPPAEVVADDLDDQWKGLDARAAARQRRDSYSGGYRCWGCKRFVSGPEATCGSCGQQHGGRFHEAYATR
jgi:rRNA maturation endonuclease Nob1